MIVITENENQKDWLAECTDCEFKSYYLSLDKAKHGAIEHIKVHVKAYDKDGKRA